MKPEPEGYPIMPASVRRAENKLVAAVPRYERGDIRRGWIEVYESNNHAQAFEFACIAADAGSSGGNPPSMIRLRDGRL